MKRFGKIFLATVVLLTICLLALSAKFGPSVQAQSGTTLGGPLPGLTSTQNNLFSFGSVSFNLTWTPNLGLGVVWTQASCLNCHGKASSPTGTVNVSGGTSGLFGTRYGKFNPDGTFNYLDGTGTFPENEGGPTLHPFANSFLSGFVGLAPPGCTATVLSGETLPADASVHNLLRAPELFGFGLIDSISDSTILANAVNQGMGIHGVANMVPDQNGNLHVGRFGQKAQIPSLLMFSAQALQNELGVTNPIFPVEHLPSGKPVPAACEGTAPEPVNDNGAKTVQDYQFMALLAPTPTQALSNQAQLGKATFETIGCNLCHVETLQTMPNAQLATDLNGNSMEVDALSNQTVTLYSDLLLHDLGPGESGGIPFGSGTLTMWRTAPLWGLSTRLGVGFMHDSSARTLNAAILAHGGEAATVIGNYTSLSSSSQNNLLLFLSSL